MRNVLTDAKIEAALPKSNRYGLFDGGGLWLLIYPTGLKCWYVIVSVKKKEHKRKIGEYPVITLAEARKMLIKEKRSLLNLLANNHKETFIKASEIWLEHWRLAQKPTPKTEVTVWRRLVKHVFPDVGEIDITVLSLQDFRKIILEIEKQQLHSTARYVLIYCKKIYRYANLRGACTNNPVESLKASENLQNYKKSMRPAITSPIGLKKLIADIDALSNPLQRLALQLMLIFFTRTKELLCAKWDEFDFEAKVWRIPAERMKARSDHVVPLPRQAIRLLEQVSEKIYAREWVFFNNGNYNPNLLLSALYKMGYKGLMCGHGFRATFATLMRDLEKAERSHIEKQLAHKETNATVRAYDRAEYMRQRRVMMQVWADYIDELR
ncbi:MAG: tyrosine-type recombinase/integrase [Pseudomonadota bacterium]